jgi:hypothetical protein
MHLCCPRKDYPRKGICITPHLGFSYLYKREARFRFSLLSYSPHESEIDLAASSPSDPSLAAPVEARVDLIMPGGLVTRRTQFSSCDECRRSRVACDAAQSRNAAAGEAPASCTRCRNRHKSCTFKVMQSLNHHVRTCAYPRDSGSKTPKRAAAAALVERSARDVAGLHLTPQVTRRRPRVAELPRVMRGLPSALSAVLTGRA